MAYDCGCNETPLPITTPVNTICSPCSEDTKCSVKMDADCVFYHLLGNKPTKLINLGVSNNTSVSDILEKIDSLLATNFNIPLTTINSSTVDLSTSGQANHTLKADVRVSAVLGNSITVNDDGIYVGDRADDGKVRVNQLDIPDYLENQLVGGTDGVVSVQTQTVSGQVQIQPSISIANLVTSINQYNEANTTTNVQEPVYTKLAPYVAYEYYGTLANFDNTGKGIASKGYDKIYICNGLNGTPDKRGRVAVGANVGVPGGALDAAVDPSINILYGIGLNTKLGEFTHANSTNENAPHTHSVSETPHSHFSVANDQVNTYDGNQLYNDSTKPIAQLGATDGDSKYELAKSNKAATIGKTSSSITGISINSSGLGNPHNNTQPSIGAYYYMYIP